MPADLLALVDSHFMCLSLLYISSLTCFMVHLFLEVSVSYLFSQNFDLFGVMQRHHYTMYTFEEASP